MRSAERLTEVLCRDSDFSILMAAPYPGPFGPRGGNSSVPSLGFSAPAHIFANTVSPLHMKEFQSERGFVSPVCSLSPTNLA